MHVLLQKIQLAAVTLRGEDSMLIPVVPSASGRYLLMKSLKALLGNTTWNINGADAATFDWVNEQALKKLTAIARDGERYLYPRFRGAFATGIKVPPPRVHRLDDPGMIPFDTALKRQLTSNVGGLPPHESEFLVILE